MFHKSCDSHSVRIEGHVFVIFQLFFEDLVDEINHTKGEESKLENIKLLTKTFFVQNFRIFSAVLMRLIARKQI